MSYIHSEMPPKVVRTDDDAYELRGQSGVVIETYCSLR